jgi:hypothetical protein
MVLGLGLSVSVRVGCSRVWGFGFRVYGLGFRVKCLVFSVRASVNVSVGLVGFRV